MFGKTPATGSGLTLQTIRGRGHTDRTGATHAFYGLPVLTGRRYVLAFTLEQEAYAERVGSLCGYVWNIGLEQRREYRRRGAFIGWAQQCRELTEAKAEHSWLAEAPSHCLQQALLDLDRACKKHGAFKVGWRSAKRWPPSFRFPDPVKIDMRRLNRRWGEVKLPRFGWVRFRWTRSLGGAIRNATVLRDGGRWHVSFCVEDGEKTAELSGKPPVGIDRGVAVAVATSDGWLRDRRFVTSGEAKRLRRLQQQLARCKRGSKRRKAVIAKIGRLRAQERTRRTDFCAWTACRLTRDHGLIAIEDLRIGNMTASAAGSTTEPGRNVRQKAGANRAILGKGWGLFASALEHKARYTGSTIVRVNPAYTSQTCSACGHVAAESRESQARFRCVACGFQVNADVNAAKNILAAGLAVTGRGDLGVAQSAKRQSPAVVAA